MPESQLPSPHNNFFRFVLSQVPLARRLLQRELPPEVLREVDLNSLQLEPGSFVDKRLRDKHSDLLFSTRLAGDQAREVLVYFLLEHKSHTDRLAVVQLLSYIVRIWEQRVQNGQPLCPIVPLVVYHGQAAWSTARSLNELLEAPEGLSRYQVRLEFPLLDLSQWQEREEQQEPILRSGLQVLKYGRSDRLEQKLHEIFKQLGGLAETGQLEVWVRAIRVYLMAVNKQMSTEEVDRIISDVFPTQIEPGSIADRLLTQGRQEGKLSGRIQLLQELLGETPTSDEALLAEPLHLLESMLAELQQRVRDRDS